MSELVVHMSIRLCLERRGEYCQVAHIQLLEEVWCHEGYYALG